MYFSSYKNSSITTLVCPKTREFSPYEDDAGAAYHLGLKREVPGVRGLAL